MRKGVWILLFVSISLGGCLPKHSTQLSDGFVKLYLRAPGANDVQLAYSVDHYLVRDIEKNGWGLWEVSVPSHLEFSYFYVVDGAFYLPDCPFKEYDDFGTQNCIYQP